MTWSIGFSDPKEVIMSVFDGLGPDSKPLARLREEKYLFNWHNEVSKAFTRYVYNGMSGSGFVNMLKKFPLDYYGYVDNGGTLHFKLGDYIMTPKIDGGIWYGMVQTSYDHWRNNINVGNWPLYPLCKVTAEIAPCDAPDLENWTDTRFMGIYLVDQNHEVVAKIGTKVLATEDYGTKYISFITATDLDEVIPVQEVRQVIIDIE